MTARQQSIRPGFGEEGRTEERRLALDEGGRGVDGGEGARGEGEGDSGEGEGTHVALSRRGEKEKNEELGGGEGRGELDSLRAGEREDVQRLGRVLEEYRVKTRGNLVGILALQGDRAALETARTSLQLALRTSPRWSTAQPYSSAAPHLRHPTAVLEA